MCGRFYNNKGLIKHNPMYGWVDVLKDWPHDIPTSDNVFPTSLIPVVTHIGTQAMRWGLIPGYATHNARIETIREKPVFAGPWRNMQRCLIPVFGYFEWKSIKNKKVRFAIESANPQPLVMAGLWENWRGESLSCTMITTDASNDLKDIHHRMPVMLEQEAALSWINGDPIEPRELDSKALRTGFVSKQS